MPAHRDALRMVDANGNRAAEGLRVLEDVARFLGDDQRASAIAKELRHALRHAIPEAAVIARDSGFDVGQAMVNPDAARSRLIDLIRANAARVQEALRSAEEAARLCAPEQATTLEALRYRAYGLESALLSRLPGWLLHRVRLYVLVDTALGADVVQIAGAAARGGAGAIQLRAKSLSVRDYHALAQRVQAAVRREGALFIVNDHAAVARAIGADGIHVGQDDLPVSAVRAVVGPCCALGVSAHTVSQAMEAVAAGADYLGLGPMYPTTTKPHEPTRGPALLDEVRTILRLPSYAIGGIDLARLRELKPRLPHGVAVAAAVCRAADPEAMASALHRLLEPDDA